MFLGGAVETVRGGVQEEAGGFGICSPSSKLKLVVKERECQVQDLALEQKASLQSLRRTFCEAASHTARPKWGRLLGHYV